ncbi:hypothetical protein TW95_gp0769 [Pandoravirus inopinatum]|uniref:F-box domain protein n=1 Tax=Pandoravirus inopinatum TaxID=1605721 RepID=A0A0B5IXK3_9VIRU|nr:hypothetical protein TW95_gp0769 [Pandoravirus inopinatum]AJF97503.1 hypothetical protein [Pandoravirus inopinatum]
MLGCTAQKCQGVDAQNDTQDKKVCMDTLPAEVGCMILGYLEPTWLASASMASRSLCQWSALVCRGEAPRMPRNAMEAAAADGAWDFMQWLWRHLYWPWTPVTLATAALHDQRLDFERLLKGRTCSVDARATAATLVGDGPLCWARRFSMAAPRADCSLLWLAFWAVIALRRDSCAQPFPTS